MTKREGGQGRLLKYLIIYSHYTRARVTQLYRSCLLSSSIFNDRGCPKRRPLKLEVHYQLPAFSIITQNNDIYVIVTSLYSPVCHRNIKMLVN